MSPRLAVALFVLVICAVSAVLGTVHSSASPSALYVSASAGSDSNAGTENEPLKTVEAAMAKLTALRNATTNPLAASINLAHGEYPLAAALAFTAALSDVALQPWGADARPLLSAGSSVSLTSNGDGTFGATLGAEFGPHLWSVFTHDTNERVLMNQIGSGDFMHWQSFDTAANPPVITPAADDTSLLMMADLSSAFAYVYHSWTSSLARVAGYNATSQTLHFSTEMPDNRFNTGSGRRYRVVNARVPGAPMQGLLPGTFHFDHASRNITFCPAAATSAATVDIIVPRLASAVTIDGANRVTITGVEVAFVRGDIEVCLARSCDGQSAAALTSAAVEVTRSTDVLFADSSVVHAGAWGVWVTESSVNVSIQSVSVTDIGAGGFRLGENAGGKAPNGHVVTHNVAVNNSVVRSGGHVVESGPGVLIQQAYSVAVTFNTIHDMFYTGVSSGWSWSWVPTSNRDILIRKNVIHHIGKGRLSDMGAVYVLGDSPDSFVEGNVCSDVESYSYGGNGLYTDQASRGYVFRNNIVHHVKSALLLQHFGIDNVFENNVFALPVQDNRDAYGDNGIFCGVHTAQASSGWEGISSFAFRRNVVYLANASTAMMCQSHVGAFANFSFAQNCYWNAADAASAIEFPDFASDKGDHSFSAAALPLAGLGKNNQLSDSCQG